MTDKTPEDVFYEKMGDEVVGTILGGIIQEPVQLSATLCLQFSAVVVEPPAPPAPVTRWGRASRWVAHQYKEHGALWAVVAFLVSLAVTILVAVL